MAEYATRDYTVVSGDDWSDEIIITGADDEPLDLTDFDAVFALKWAGGELELTVGDGVTITPADGKIDVVLTSAQTAALPLGRLTKFQLRLTESDDDLITRMLGFFVVTDAVIEEA